jgi:DNA replication protein DnaC
MSSRHTELTSQLRALKLSTMAESFSDIALKAVRNGLSHEAFLHELVRLECEAREQRRRARLLQESGLPREKTFRTLQLGAFPPLIRQQIERLRRGAFVQQAVNVVVVGKPGAGKSHLLASLGHAMVEQGYGVLWRSTAQLMQRLLAAKRDLRLPQELAKLDRYACLILDDIGYVQHDQDEMEILFTLLSERYERKTVMISTNLVFSEWTRILDIIKVGDILAGVFFHGMELCQSLTAYCRMNGAYAPLPASIRPHSRPSCRILPARWSTTSTARPLMATSAKATARSPTPTALYPRQPIACCSSSPI